MADGTLKNAGDLKVGDLIRTQHEHTLEWGEYLIDYVKQVNSERLKITFDHVEFTCSPTHTFYSEENGWILSCSLKIGDIISGHTIIKIESAEPGKVVAIQVDGGHTYISEDLLSHNKLVSPPPTGK